MRVKMVPAILTTPAKQDCRQEATGRVSSADDDDLGTGEDSNTALKLVAIPNFDHSYVVDWDDDSLSSTESSFEASLITRPDAITGKAQDSSSDDDIDAEDTAHKTSALGFCTIQNPVFEGLPRQINTSVMETEFCKQTTDSVQNEEDISGNDEGNYVNDFEERSRLWVAAQATGIPSDNSFSDDSERSRLLTAAQAASFSSDDSLRDVSQRSKLMAASFPSDESFSDDSEDGSVYVSSISGAVSKRVVPTDARVLQDNEDLESGAASSFLNVESDSERSSNDEESQNNEKVLSNTTEINLGITDYSCRISSRNLTEAGEDPAKGSSGSEQGDQPSGNDWRKPTKNVNSASFSGISTSSKWSNFKTKIFYSFRALKAKAGSSSDGSRTISVKNLAREVTDDRLYDLFQDSGSILDIRIIRDSHSGLSSAYVEFESGHAARKAVRKSGKKMEGRVIFCDVAYENPQGSRSVPRVGHGVRERSELVESDPASTNSRVLKNHSTFEFFDPELREGDAKFLSCFSEQLNFSSYTSIQSCTSNPEEFSSPLSLTGDQQIEGSQGLAPCLDSYEHTILMLGKTQADLEQFAYFDAQDLETQQFLTLEQKKPCPWRFRKQRFLRLFLPWKRRRWQWWQVAKQSSAWARRKPSRAPQPKAIDTKQKASEESVKPWCSY